LLHEQNSRSSDKPLVARQARHLYDLVRLWNVAKVSESKGFRELFEGVKAHRAAFFDYAWVNYEELKPSALQLIPPQERLSEWRADYEAMQAMFYQEPMRFETLLKEIESIQQALSS